MFFLSFFLFRFQGWALFGTKGEKKKDIANIKVKLLKLNILKVFVSLRKQSISSKLKNVCTKLTKVCRLFHLISVV